MRHAIITSILFISVIVGMAGSLSAQSRRDPGIKTTVIKQNFYKIHVHHFVNMLVFNGPDGALLVDSGFEPVDLIAAELKNLGVQKVKYIINTHSHGDHVEGNAVLGQDAVITSSHRCWEVLAASDEFSKSGLPNLTFTDSLSIHFNYEIINLYFMPGHSDDDIIVHFAKANILCIGDFGFRKPYATWPGYSGNVYNMEHSMNWMANRFSDHTIIVAGHEDDYSMADLKSDAAMVSEAIALVRPLIQQGKTFDQIVEENPLGKSGFSIVRENAERWIWNVFNNERPDEDY